MPFPVTDILMTHNSSSHYSQMIRQYLLTSEAAWQTFRAGWRTTTFNSTLLRQNCLGSRLTHNFITTYPFS